MTARKGRRPGGIIPGGTSFEVMPGHLIPSKQPECGRLGRGERSLELMRSRLSTEHEAWGWGPAPLIEERASINQQPSTN